MKISIETLRKTKGIGSKTLERIIEQHSIVNKVKMFKSKYNENNGIDLSKPINLINGDMVEELNRIPDKTIDLILTDLPYGTTANNWDSIIPFEILWGHYERIIKDRGAIVLFSSGRFTNELINSNKDLYRYKWIWKKSRIGNFVNAKNRPMTTYEEILVFSKGITANTSNVDLKMVYNPQGLIPSNETVKTGNTKFGTMHGKRPSHKEEYIREYTNYPVDLIEFNSVNKPVHPTQKPVELLEYLIKTYTNDNDVVLDSTMGSGSTGVAAKNTGRKFIGVELDEKYFNIAKERIESE